MLVTPESEYVRGTALNLFHPTAPPLLERFGFFLFMTQPPMGERFFRRNKKIS